MDTKILFYPEYRYPGCYPFLENKQEDTQQAVLLKQWIKLSLEEIENLRDTQKVDFLVCQKRRELMEGAYGKSVQEYCRELGSEQLAWIANALCLQERGESIVLYGAVLTRLIRKGALYQNIHEKNQLFFYVGCGPDRKICQQIELVNMLFLPWGYEVKLYWKEAFAVIGEDCSVLGYMRL